MPGGMSEAAPSQQRGGGSGGGGGGGGGWGGKGSGRRRGGKGRGRGGGGGGGGAGGKGKGNNAKENNEVPEAGTSSHQPFFFQNTKKEKMRVLDVCMVVFIVLVTMFVSLFMVIPIANNWDIFQFQQSPYPPLLPWFIFSPAVALQDLFLDLIHATTPPLYQVAELTTSYWKSEVTYMLTKSTVMDFVGYNPFGVSCTLTARILNLNSHILCEFMKAGCQLGLLKQEKRFVVGQKDEREIVYSLTSAGRLLQSNVPGSYRDMVLLVNEEVRQSFRALGTISIYTDQSGIQEAIGYDFWDYTMHHPTVQETFDRAMQGQTPITMQAILGDWIPINQTGTICDMGGGLGTSVQHIVQRYPQMQAIVFEQPRVAKRANEQFAKDETTNIRAIGGHFFQIPYPSVLEQCDTFFLKSIFHDWPDEDCVAILERIKEVAKPNSELVLAEFVMHPEKAGGSGDSSSRLELNKRLTSVAMVSINKFGAKERTYEEFQELINQAGLGQTCNAQDGQCNKGILEEIPLRDLTSVLRLKL